MAYYVGGSIGSLMVAGDAFYKCKAGPAAASRVHQLLFASGAMLVPPMQLFLMNHPEIFDMSLPNRHMYGIHARLGTGLK